MIAFAIFRLVLHEVRMATAGRCHARTPGEKLQKVSMPLTALPVIWNWPRKKPLLRCVKAKEKAAEIIEQANKRANQIIDEAKEAARAEGARLVAAAQAEVEQEVNRAKETA